MCMSRRRTTLLIALYAFSLLPIIVYVLVCIRTAYIGSYKAFIGEVGPYYGLAGFSNAYTYIFQWYCIIPAIPIIVAIQFLSAWLIFRTKPLLGRAFVTVSVVECAVLLIMLIICNAS